MSKDNVTYLPLADQLNELLEETRLEMRKYGWCPDYIKPDGVMRYCGKNNSQWVVVHRNRNEPDSDFYFHALLGSTLCPFISSLCGGEAGFVLHNREKVNMQIAEAHLAARKAKKEGVGAV